jgi:hypothetical protein
MQTSGGVWTSKNIIAVVETLTTLLIVSCKKYLERTMVVLLGSASDETAY